MPMIYVHKLAADMKFRADHRLIGVDFDSLVHHWSSQGLNYYVLAKLLWNPHLDVDALIADYCQAAYGPAAEPMRRYYAMIETRTDSAAHTYTAKKRGADRDKYQYWKAIPQMFPDEVLTAWRNQLRMAAKQVPGDSVYAQRIRWVELGLDYADIERRMFRLTSRKDLSAEEKKKVAAIYAEKQSWYKAHLGDWSIYGPLLRWRENGALFGNSARASDVE